jgi:aspartyl-tRNA(Asn)/glutamyl-tRNA(Gln) amidotransferase subunit A
MGTLASLCATGNEIRAEAEAPMAELHDLTLAELSAALKQRSVSSVEATQHALDRISRLDSREGLNAFLSVLVDQAMAEAHAADQRRAAGDARGALDGIPIALKDLFDTAGVRTTGGSRLLADRIPEADATVVGLLRAAGAVILGKTNMMEFAYGHPHPDFGETANPWDRARTAGGSSGGSAAAVAAGLCWGALGSDTGGSIRSPAAYCGVTGLKPTHGLVSLAGVLPLSWSLDHAGPLARTAADCAILLAAIAGHDPADPHSAPAATIDDVSNDLKRLTEPEAIPPDLKGLRIGAVHRFFGQAVTPGLARAVERAMPTFAGLGAEVIAVDLAPELLALIVPTISAIYPAEAAAYHHGEGWYPARKDDYGPLLRDDLEQAMVLPAHRYVQALRDRRRIQVAFAELFARVDLLAWPAQPLVAPPLGTTAAAVEELGGGATTIDVEIGATGPANLTGEPGIALPCGFVEGLPVGLHLQGPPFADSLVVRAGIAFQTATGIPPIPALSPGRIGNSTVGRK